MYLSMSITLINGWTVSDRLKLFDLHETSDHILSAHREGDRRQGRQGCWADPPQNQNRRIRRNRNCDFCSAGAALYFGVSIIERCDKRLLSCIVIKRSVYNCACAYFAYCARLAQAYMQGCTLTAASESSRIASGVQVHLHSSVVHNASACRVTRDGGGALRQASSSRGAGAAP